MPIKVLFRSLLAIVFCVSLVGLSQTSTKPPTEPPAESRVDINHATLEELLKVPGMTRTWAARIVRFRPYRAKNELLDHGVISSEVYARIKNYIIAHRDEQN